MGRLFPREAVRLNKTIYMWEQGNDIITVVCDDTHRTITAYTIYKGMKQPIYILTGLSTFIYKQIKKQLSEATKNHELNDFFDHRFFGGLSL